MRWYARFAVAAVAAIHAAIVYVEMVAWLTLGPKVFRSLDADLFAPTQILAANQGLYNAILVAGLVWSLVIRDPVWARRVAEFFLACVAVAGAYGAASAGAPLIAVVQTLPAALALAALRRGGTPA
ncbi:MAG: DUF1304 domain-containing protein [Gemmobacter sp.]